MKIIKEAKEAANLIVNESKEKAKEEANRIMVNSKMISKMQKSSFSRYQESSRSHGSRHC